MPSISDKHAKRIITVEPRIDERVLRIKRRKCPICKTIVRGRSDKKFCSVKCKSFYHRRLRQVTSDIAVEIDKILHRNRSILLEIMGKTTKKKKVKRLVLSQKKFSFNHITHYIINSRGKTFHYVYDFAWMTFSDDEVLIVRK